MNPHDSGAAVTASAIPTDQGLAKVMTASQVLVFGLQGAPGFLSYFSEKVTPNLRILGLYVRIFVEDLVVV